MLAARVASLRYVKLQGCDQDGCSCSLPGEAVLAADLMRGLRFYFFLLTFVCTGRKNLKTLDSVKAVSHFQAHLAERLS